MLSPTGGVIQSVVKLPVVIPAQAGIQWTTYSLYKEGLSTGFRVKPGMTTLDTCADLTTL